MAWSNPRKSQLLAATGMALALTAWAYWPGLSGPFLFDDFANLDKLGAFGPIDNWRTLLFYLTSGNADPTGRPVAMLSFLLDAQHWPADPRPFKQTNLILHLLNIVLLGLVVMRFQAALARRHPSIQVSSWTPWLAAALWGAHPFFVSTTLYVVQREAMLPLTFALLALLGWHQAISRFSIGKMLAGWLWAILAFGTCTLLAGFSKANGFLVPLLAGLAYLWILRPARAIAPQRSADLAAAICLGIPSLLILAYLVQHGISLWSQPYLPGRDWTIVERLMSQPRALWDYVWRLVLPRSGGGGLFVEGFAASRGWVDPFSTLPAALALAGSLVAALALRQRYPITSFAWLFFLVAHLLESSVVPLELYFEHRNYLPAAFLGWPIAHLLLKPGPHARYRTVFSLLLLITLLMLTHQRSIVWGDPKLLTALTAVHQEDSTRSQIAEAQRQLSSGNIKDGLKRIHALQAKNPHSVYVALNAIGMECMGKGSLLPDTLARARDATQATWKWTFGMNEWLQKAASAPATRQCRGFGLAGLRSLLDAAEANPANQHDLRKRDLWHVRGRIALAEGQPEAALEWFDAALELMPDPDYALVQAAALGNACAQSLGVSHLDHYLSISKQEPIHVSGMHGVHRWLLRRYDHYGTEISQLRQRLLADTSVPPVQDCD